MEVGICSCLRFSCHSHSWLRPRRAVVQYAKFFAGCDETHGAGARRHRDRKIEDRKMEVGICSCPKFSCHSHSWLRPRRAVVRYAKFFAGCEETHGAGARRHRDRKIEDRKMEVGICSCPKFCCHSHSWLRPRRAVLRYAKFFAGCEETHGAGARRHRDRKIEDRKMEVGICSCLQFSCHSRSWLRPRRAVVQYAKFFAGCDETHGAGARTHRDRKIEDRKMEVGICSCPKFCCHSDSWLRPRRAVVQYAKFFAGCDGTHGAGARRHRDRKIEDRKIEIGICSCPKFSCHSRSWLRPRRAVVQYAKFFAGCDETHGAGARRHRDRKIEDRKMEVGICSCLQFSCHSRSWLRPRRAVTSAAFCG